MLNDATLTELDVQLGPLNTSTTAASAVTVCLADVKPEPIKWLWPERIPLGKLTLLAGDPGLGKSTLTVALAANISTGKPWPVGNGPCPLGSVLILSAEDDPADTLRPRLDAAGADSQRVHVLTAVRRVTEEGEQEGSFSLRSDLAALESTLERLEDCRLVVIDPITAYLDGTDSHKNADVRGLLAPLNALAQRTGAAFMLVSHLNKGAGGSALYRTTGSLAFVAAARAAFLVTRDRDNPVRRLMLPAKCNLSPDTTGLAYTMETVDTSAGSQPVIAWEPEPVTVTADEALAVEASEGRTEREEATAWLCDYLAAGPKTAREVQAAARDAGLTLATVRRAKDALGVRTTKTRFDGGWEWALPAKLLKGSQDAHQNNVSTFDASEHLRQPGGCTAEEYRAAKDGV